jgi:lysophospholipase L1-like esterase
MLKAQHNRWQKPIKSIKSSTIAAIGLTLSFGLISCNTVPVVGNPYSDKPREPWVQRADAQNVKALEDGFVSDQQWTRASSGWGPVELDKGNGGSSPNDGPAISVAGTTYAKGLGTHAVSAIEYKINPAKNCSTFSAVVGLDDAIRSQSAYGSVTFEVWMDGVKSWDSGLMTVTGTPRSQKVNLPITAKSTLELRVTNGQDAAGYENWYDHADWADARVTCSGATPTPTPTPTPSGTPTIDGKASRRIMALGDSITAGYPSTIGGYRSELKAKLQQAGYNVTFVGSQSAHNPANATDLPHEGHSGWTIPQINSIVNGSLSYNGTSADRILDTYDPDVVLLMIGTNDEIQTNGRATVDSYKVLLDSIFAKKPNVRVIVAPFIHCSVFSDVQADDFNYGNRNLQYINNATYETDRAGGVVGLVTAYQSAGRRITFVDAMHRVVPAGLADSVWSTFDGIHPNITYHPKIGAVWFKALQDVSNSQDSSSPLAVPTGLSAKANGTGLDLLWTRNSNNESGFQIDATTDPLFLTNITTFTAPAGSRSAIVPVKAASTYYVRIRAVNGANTSENSYPYRAVTP